MKSIMREAMKTGNFDNVVTVKSNKRVSAITGVPLNKKQLDFVNLYTSPDPYFFGVASRCYAKAYGLELPKFKNACDTGGHALLKKEHIYKAIRRRITKEGFNDENADKQLTFLISQHADFKAKLGAIKEYNALKGRTNKAAGLQVNGNISITQLFDKAAEKKRVIINQPEEL